MSSISQVTILPQHATYSERFHLEVRFLKYVFSYSLAIAISAAEL